MSAIERMTIALPEPMAASIRAAVNAGEYASTSEVMRDALRLWEQRRILLERDILLLQEKWDAGKASGPPVPFDAKKIIVRAKKRRAE